MSAEVVLQAYKLNKRFGQRVALRDVSLHVAEGETVVIMGPSGCGKSTLLRCLSGLIPPDAGEVWFRGLAVRDLEGEALRAFRRRVGFVFQHFNLIGHLSVLENVLLGPVAAGMPPRTARREAVRALERVGLGDRLHARPAALSGGEQQRVAIARSLVLKPELILWDEPTAALDPVMVEEVLSLMQELAQEEATAMVIVTHELPFALAAADRIVLMENGHVVAEGAPDDVIFRSQAEVSRRYRRLYTLRYGGGARALAAARCRNDGARSRIDRKAPGAVGATGGPRKVLYT